MSFLTGRAAGPAGLTRDAMKLNVGLWLGPALGLRMGGPRRLVLNSPKTELERAPGFAHGHWPDFNQPGYRLRVDRRYGARPGAADALYVRATEMLKGEVRDRSGKRIGAVQDLVVAMHGERADCVVIAFDRPWSTRNKLVAMPMPCVPIGRRVADLRRYAGAAAGGALVRQGTLAGYRRGRAVSGRGGSLRAPVARARDARQALHQPRHGAL